MWPYIISTGIGLLGSYAAQRQQRAGMKDAKKHMADMISKWEEYKTESDEYMDSSSQLNQDMMNRIRQGASDVLGQSGLQQQRLQNQFGLGGFSGIQNQAMANQTAGIYGQSQSAIDENLMANRKYGSSLLAQYMQGMRQNQEGLANMSLQNAAMKANLTSSMFSGIQEGYQQAHPNLWPSTPDPDPNAPGSDRNLKKNIKHIGKSNDGINIYEFEYKDKKYGEGRYRGVMAQEVPWASVQTKEYLGVDYSKIDVNFERVI